MSEGGVEQQRVKDYIRKYLDGKKNYDFASFGNFEKVEWGGNTWAYIVEVEMKNWDIINYAIVPVTRANPLGIIMMNSNQITRVVKTLIDGLSREF